LVDKAETRVIVNPTAAAGAVGREWPNLRSHLAARGLVFSEALTEGPGHATDLAAKAVGDGCGLVVAVGGDGTVNEVVNGLCAGPGSTAGAHLGIICRGTGCDLVRTLGLRDPRAAVAALTEREITRPMDVGEVVCQGAGGPQRRLFVNAAGLGFDGEVVENLLNAKLTGRSIGGTVPYLIQVVNTALRYASKRARASLDQETVEGLFISFFVCNGRYLAGGMKVAPEAKLDDGFFDVVVIRSLSRLGLLLRFPFIYLGQLELF